MTFYILLLELKWFSKEKYFHYNSEKVDFFWKNNIEYSEKMIDYIKSQLFERIHPKSDSIFIKISLYWIIRYILKSFNINNMIKKGKYNFPPNY